MGGGPAPTAAKSDCSPVDGGAGGGGGEGEGREEVGGLVGEGEGEGDGDVVGGAGGSRGILDVGR